MPLPDERPRQSVANLIGRFEQKRQSTSSIVPPVLPRSTSVTSHITGDSAKEEVRERREWFPKSVTAGEKPDVFPATSLPAASSLPTSSPISETVTLPVTDYAIEAPTLQSPPVADPIELTKASTAKTLPTRKPASTTSTTSTRPSTTTRTPQKSPIHSAPKNPPTAQPLRPQNTGTSIRSTKSTASTPAGAKISKPANKATVSTPSRAKTPTPSRPKTPGGAPASASRQKTLSTGLFAPTAASLARVRHAQPPVPIPVKKVTLSSSAAERLSKPTAASSSRVRDPAPVARGGNATGSPAHRGPKATAKSRTGPAGARPKEPGSKDGNGTVKAAGTAAAAGVVVDELEAHADEPAENGDHSTASMSPEVDVHEEDTHYHVKELGDMSHEVESEGLSHEVDPEEHVEDEEASEGPSIVVSPSPAPHENLVGEHAKELETHRGPPSQNGNGDTHEEHAEDDVEAEPQARPGVDIDDIINLLETKRNISLSEPHPVSEERVPEDTPDIPDEE